MDRMFRFEDEGRLRTLEEMTDDVAFAVRNGDPDGSTVVGFANWVNDVFTAYDVIDVGLDRLVGYWLRDLIDRDPDGLYACTGFREAKVTVRRVWFTVCMSAYMEVPDNATDAEVEAIASKWYADATADDVLSALDFGEAGESIRLEAWE